MIDLNFKYKDTIAFLKKESPFIPDIAIVLGSGFLTLLGSRLSRDIQEEIKKNERDENENAE